MDIDAMQTALAETARSAIGAGSEAALDVGRWLGNATTSTWRRIRPPDKSSAEADGAIAQEPADPARRRE